MPGQGRGTAVPSSQPQTAKLSAATTPGARHFCLGASRARAVPEAELLKQHKVTLTERRGKLCRDAPQLPTSDSVFPAQEACCSRLLSKTKPRHLLRSHRALQNRVKLATAYKKLLKNHSSFASAILKGNNCIHYIKVVTKYIRRDYDPLTKSSETAAGGIKEL